MGQPAVERADDPVWNDRARSLLRFLQKPRDWTDLSDWARREGLTQVALRNTIAHAHYLIGYRENRWWCIVELPESDDD